MASSHHRLLHRLLLAFRVGPDTVPSKEYVAKRRIRGLVAGPVVHSCEGEGMPPWRLQKLSAIFERKVLTASWTPLHASLREPSTERISALRVHTGRRRAVLRRGRNPASNLTGGRSIFGTGSEGQQRVWEMLRGTQCICRLPY